MSDINIQELKDNAPLIPYVKKFYPKVAIKGEQSNNVVNAICPFHDDKDTPSLALYNNGTWKCFGCGKHGDVIDFVGNIENIDFMDACKLIANNIGYNLNLKPESPAWTNYMNVMDSHMRRYWHNLQNNQEAMNYLVNERGLKQETINEFRLGLVYSDEYKYRTDIGNISNRISIPLLEQTSISKPRTLGAAYRGFHGEVPKYINDTNKDGRQGQDPALNGIFIKSNLLYGYPQAKKEVRNNNCAFIVEGYFDVISMHQTGFKNTLGVMGTYLSQAQLETLKKLTNNVIVFLDGDSAGIKGMIKMSQQLYSYNFNVLMCVMQDKMDPDELCRKYLYNITQIDSVIKENTYDAMDYIIYSATKEFKARQIIEQKKIIKEFEIILSSINSTMERDMYLKRVYKEIGLL